MKFKRWSYMDEAGADGSAGGDSGLADAGNTDNSGGVNGGGEPSGVLDASQSNVAVDWRTGLPAEIKDAASLADFKDVGGLAKAYMDSKSSMGKMVKLPSEEAGQEDRQAFRERMMAHDNNLMVRPDSENPEQMAEYYRSIGVPEDATPYLEVIDVPEGVQFDDSRMANLAAIAHANNIPPKQFGKAISEILTADAQSFADSEVNRGEGITSLKGEWAGAYDEKVARAATMAELTNAPAELIASVKGGKANATTLKWLDGLANSLGSEGSEVSKQVGDIGSDTLADTTQKRDDLTARMINENMSHVDYAAAQKRLLRYNTLIAGNGSLASS